MRSFQLLLSFLALGFSSTLVAAVRHGLNDVAGSIDRHPARAARTNAERFAQGLTPLPPSRSRRIKGSPVRRTDTSPIPLVPRHGAIQVLDASNNLKGYVSATLQSTSRFYGYQTAYDTGALAVSFSLPLGTTSGTGLEIYTENSNAPAGVKYFGLVLSQTSEIAFAGGANAIAFAAGVPQTANQGRAAKVITTVSPSVAFPAESPVWSIDLLTGAIVPIWTNQDGSKAASPYGLYVSGTSPILYYGDTTRTGRSPVSLKFVEVI